MRKILFQKFRSWERSFIFLNNDIIVISIIKLNQRNLLCTYELLVKIGFLEVIFMHFPMKIHANVF